MNFRVGQFGGLQPKTEPRLLGDSQSQVASNCDLKRGSLCPFKTTSNVANLPDANRLTIFPDPDTAGSWLSWLTDVDVVASPLAEDQFRRLYYTGDGVPKVSAVLTPGAARTVYSLGLPAPSAVATVATQDKLSSFMDTRIWSGAWYTNGPLVSISTITEGAMPADPTAVDPVMVEIVPGKEYKLSRLPMRPTGATVFLLSLAAYDSDGRRLGQLYPTGAIPDDFGNDLTYKSIKLYATATESLNPVPGAFPDDNDKHIQVTFRITYDASTIAGYSTDRAYVYTFVTAMGEEGPPSTPTAIIAADLVQDVALSGMDATAPADTCVTKKRIYRTVTTDTGTQYQYVAEIDIATPTYLDELTDGDTSEVLETTNYDAPLTDMNGLVYHPAGFMVGFSGRTVCFSEVFRFHAWPTDYQLTLDYDIVGLGISENSVIVMTAGAPYIVAGSSPDAMTPALVNVEQACVSKRGIAKLGEMVVYPSPDGLVGIQAGAASVITEQFYKRDQWQALAPTTMIGEVHDQQYFGFTTTGCIVFAMSANGSILVTTDQTARGLYSDALTDLLYLISGTEILSWNTGAINRTATWRSKDIHLPRPASFGVVRMVANSYPQTVNLYAKEVLVCTMTIANETARRIPRLRNEKQWSVEVVANDEVYELCISDSMGEM